MTLDQLLAELDKQNWAAIAHRVSVETGMDVTAEQARALAFFEVSRAYEEGQ